jgi:hypothetical protein
LDRNTHILRNLANQSGGVNDLLYDIEELVVGGLAIGIPWREFFCQLFDHALK